MYCEKCGSKTEIKKIQIGFDQHSGQPKYIEIDICTKNPCHQTHETSSPFNSYLKDEKQNWLDKLLHRAIRYKCKNCGDIHYSRDY